MYQVVREILFTQENNIYRQLLLREQSKCIRELAFFHFTEFFCTLSGKFSLSTAFKFLFTQVDYYFYF